MRKEMMAKELVWTVAALAASIRLFSFFLKEDIQSNGKKDES